MFREHRKTGRVAAILLCLLVSAGLWACAARSDSADGASPAPGETLEAPQPAPDPPTGLEASFDPQTRTVYLSWEYEGDAVFNLKIYRRDGEAVLYTNREGITGTSADLPNAGYDTTYSYGITAVNAAGAESKPVSIEYTTGPEPGTEAGACTLAVAVNDPERGAVTQPGMGDFTYAEGESVELFALKKGENCFDHWEMTGDVTLDDLYNLNTTVHMGGDGTVTAVFISTEAAGVVTVGEAEGGTCTLTYVKHDLGEDIHITAVPDEGYRFVQWHGTCVDGSLFYEGDMVAEFIFPRPHINVTITPEFAPDTE